MDYSSDEAYEREVMENNVTYLADEVVGHRIVSVEQEPISVDRWGYRVSGLQITLDNGKKVILKNTDDCCAYTELESFLLDPSAVEHVVTGVVANDGFDTWHILADMGDVLTLSVGWSSGNTGYYGFGFNIEVVDSEE